MTEAAAAVQEAPAEEPKTLTPEEKLAHARKVRLQIFDQLVDSSRMQMLEARGVMAPSVQPTSDELKAMCPLPGDTMRYAKTKDGQPRLALDKNGLLAFPKQRGRRHPHMTKHAQAIKSEYLRQSQRLLEEHAGKLIKEAEAKGEKFVGVPQADFPAIAAKATLLAQQICKAKDRMLRRYLRRMKDANRRVNSGLLPGNQVNQFVTRAGQYGA